MCERCFQRPPRGVIARHVWLSHRLLDRRRLQAGSSRGRAPLDLYTKLLNGILPLDGTWKLYEILSDGAGHLEPFWHGFEVDQEHFYPFEEEERSRLAREIRTRRSEQENIDSHRDLGRILVEPALFCITGRRDIQAMVADNVWYHAPSGWHSLDDAAETLPLEPKVRHSLGLDGSIARIRDSLLTLSSQVLWPVFWPDAEENTYLSLVCVQGTAARATAGVWALHAGSRLAHLPEIQGRMPHLRDAIDPPLLSLTDVLATEYARDNTDEHRRSDLRFFVRSTARPEMVIGEDLSLDDGAIATLYEEDGLALYERRLRVDYLHHYGRMLDRTVSYLSERPIRYKEPRSPLALALRYAFVAIRVAELHQEEQNRGRARSNWMPSERLIQQSPLALTFFRIAEWLCLEMKDPERLTGAVRECHAVDGNIVQCDQFLGAAVRALRKNAEQDPGSDSVRWCCYALRAIAGVLRGRLSTAAERNRVATATDLLAADETTHDRELSITIHQVANVLRS